MAIKERNRKSAREKRLFIRFGSLGLGFMGIIYGVRPPFYSVQVLFIINYFYNFNMNLLELCIEDLLFVL